MKEKSYDNIIWPKKPEFGNRYSINRSSKDSKSSILRKKIEITYNKIANVK